MNFRFFLKKTVIVFLYLFLFFSSIVKAHQDVFLIKTKGNIHSMFMSERQALTDKLMIFFSLSDKLQKQYFPHSVPLCIYFEHDYTYIDSARYAIGYGHINSFVNALNKPKADSGILLSVRDRDFDMKKLLNLVNAAYENIELLKNNGNLVPIGGYYQREDSFNSISNDLIKKFSERTHKNVESLLKERIFRKDASSGFIRDSSIDFYFQNNRFNFYYSQIPNFYDSNKGPQSVIISLDNIFEKIEYQGLGFIFSNDSTFFLIGYSSKNKYQGPYLISDMEIPREGLSVYYHKSPFRGFTFLLSHYNHYSKVLFIPDSNLVISNYDRIEHQFVNNYLRKVKPNNLRINDRILWLSLLLVSIIINLVLISRRSFSSKK